MQKKTRPSYSEEQKAEVKRLLQEGCKHDEIVEHTKVGKSTVIKIAAEMKSGSKANKRTESTLSSPLDSIKAELVAIKTRKLEVEELLNGKLKQELDALTQKESALDNLLNLYK